MRWSSRLTSSIAILLLLGSLACAVSTRAIIVRGFLDGAYKSRLVPGVKVHIVVNPDAKAPTLDAELKDRATEYLQNSGYEIVPSAEAEYFIFFGFGTAPVDSAAKTDDLAPLMMKDLPEDEHGYSMRYIHFFSATAIDAREYRDNRNLSYVWYGESRLRDVNIKNPPQPEELVNLLMLAVLDTIGQEHGWFKWNEDEGNR